jgi:hypothetical protein
MIARPGGRLSLQLIFINHNSRNKTVDFKIGKSRVYVPKDYKLRGIAF